MFKQTQPFQSADFINFYINGDSLNTSKHIVDTTSTISGIRIQLYSTIWALHIIHDDTKLTFSVGRFQLFSIISWYKHQPFQSADFNYFHTNGDTLDSSNHTCWYKTNIFSSDNSTIFNNLNSSNHTCSNKHYIFSRPISTILIQLATIWTLQIIHVDIKSTISGTEFNYCQQLVLFKSYMLIQNQPFHSAHINYNLNNLKSSNLT